MKPKDLHRVVETLYDEIGTDHVTEHEAEYIEKAYKKIVYAGRPADPTEIKTIQTMYKMYLKRKLA